MSDECMRPVLDFRGTYHPDDAYVGPWVGHDSSHTKELLWSVLVEERDGVGALRDTPRQDHGGVTQALYFLEVLLAKIASHVKGIVNRRRSDVVVQMMRMPRLL